MLSRAERRLRADEDLAESVRSEAENTFGFKVALSGAKRAEFRREIQQILRFGIFVEAQKLVLYRVLEDAGPKRRAPFSLDPLTFPASSSDPRAVRRILEQAAEHAIDRSEDFETAFRPQPFAELIFTRPQGAEEIGLCRAGAVWDGLRATISSVAWISISRNLVGFLYELIVEEEFRHSLGQFYTRPDVVDVLTTFAVQSRGDLVLDPATGGGSFLRSVYERKTALGETHEDALATIWGFELTGFAAELSTITLATANSRARRPIRE